MTIEAKLDRIANLLEVLNAKFDHIGGAVNPTTEKALREARQVPQTAQEKQERASGTQPGGDGLSYEKDIKPIALALAKKDRAKLTTIWKQLGVSVGTELKPGQFAQAKQLIEEAGK